MKPTRSCTLALAILLSSTLTAGAALPPLMPEELTQSAELVITGTAVEIEVSEEGQGDNIDWKFEIEAAVESVEKGDGAQGGDRIRIDCWRVKVRPDGWAGPSGHGSVPAEGSKFKMWLRESGSGWEPLQPNGIELLGGSKAFSVEAGDGEAPSEIPGWLAIPFLIVFLAGVWIFIRLTRKFKPTPGSYDGGGEGGGN